MILIDPDLDPDPSPSVSGSPSHALTPSNMPRKGRMPSVRLLARFLADAQSAVRLSGQVTVLLTSDAAIRRMNRRFRGKDKATDVLSFPAADFTQVSRTRRGAPAKEIAGDLAISVPTARRQAAERDHSLATEIKVLILHGLLHLAGYDHESDSGQMSRKERQLRARLDLPQGLIERSLEPRTRRTSRSRKPASGNAGKAARS